MSDSVFSLVRDTWRKNGPELVCSLTRGLPDFVTRAAPGDLNGIPVFCYHHISGTTLESHLKFLNDNNYFTLTADEFLDILRDGHESRPTPNSRPVVISFDDGLMNLHDTVFPLLRRYDVRAVAFISPAFHRPRSISSQVPTCSWDQIETMHASGLVDFQSHTFAHRLICRWPCGVPLSGTSNSACEPFRGPALSMADDLARAREGIESRLGKRVRHLAFPQYEGSADAIRIGRACGYEAFYWGVRSWKPINRPGDDCSRIVRLSGEFVPRLPGHGRTPLRTILRDRYGRNAARWWRGIAEGAR